MAAIYASDIMEFDRDDWEDFFTTHWASPDFDWEAFRRGKRVEMTFPDDVRKLGGLASSAFFFDRGERNEPFQWSEDLEYLVKDLARLREVKGELYRKSSELFDAELDGEISFAVDRFGEAYDSACARALLQMVKELQEAE